MRTDSLFYKVFQTLPGTFFELLEENSQLAQNYNFKAVELKELAKRTDGVFLPKRDGDPIYFVEVQFQKDEDLYYRLMQEVFVYLGQNRWQHSWQAVVFWAKRSLDTGIPRCYDGEVQTGYLRSLYLDETPDTSDSIGLGLVRLVVEPETNVQHRVQQLERCARALPVAQQRNAIELVEQALVYKFPERPWRELEAMFGLTEWKQTRFYQEVNAEGRITEAQILVMRLLKKRFPEMTEEINNLVQGLSLSNLEGLTDIIFELNSWEDFLSWLSRVDQ
ncbi:MULTISPECIES: Rpn family recombination-promoting nuclease/putative transposase [unclassified Moorena]|uniref:Rpn family recombination-promoting nuclease/putative transposase n=1 Tax=unclassified Moorena TaxID=2683338 RepID=UPI0014018B3A|nr:MULTISPECIES: Rpn family recombination-promoting nuclease/putative transposase [unclassified Moorena]NEO12361.1 Rpn family recombination-promoting nuclease/putative transposase [Moorena sp. SIO3E8]NEP99349.1 Rpn family recombination-promoting nuclease/putative transposase [Moorena sp. SIO3F7]